MRAASHHCSIVLVGGGHAHALLLHELAVRPLQGSSISLISDVGAATYSGMLAGFIAGAYAEQSCQIDLERLALRAGVTFRRGVVIGVDRVGQQVHLADGTRSSYDLLSLNPGSAPDLTAVAGLPAYAVPVRPAAGLIKEAERLIAVAAKEPVRLLIVGGGVAGCELALCFKERLGDASAVTILEQSATVSGGLPAAARHRVERALKHAGVAVITGQALTTLSASEYDGVIVATPGVAPPWLAASGLAVDDRGCVQVGDTLRSVSDPRVFAVGDAASIVGAPRPKSGVYAVRHAKPLGINLRRAVAGQAFTHYAPQSQSLVLINCGDQRAILSRGRWSAEGRWVWWLKDVIDRHFVSQFL